MSGPQDFRSEPAAAVLALEEIEEGLSELVFAVEAEELGPADRYYSFIGPIRASLRLSRALQTFSISGTLTWRVRGECCRCLAVAEKELQTEFALLLQRREATEDELEAYADEEAVEIVDPGTREYDLTDCLREAVALELPVRVYCREDCKGLCPICGIDLNTGTCNCAETSTDPRWETLARLRDSK